MRKTMKLLTLAVVLLWLPLQCLALSDGDYCVSLDLSGGSGKAAITTPAPLTVENGEATVELTWSSSSYDYMLVDGIRYDNLSEPGRNSTFRIPITNWDTGMDVIADTTAMGKPVEIHYELFFYSDSVADRSQLPQEAAMRVLAMAAGIIVVGGVLNAWLKRRNA